MSRLTFLTFRYEEYCWFTNWEVEITHNSSVKEIREWVELNIQQIIELKQSRKFRQLTSDFYVDNPFEFIKLEGYNSYNNISKSQKIYLYYCIIEKQFEINCKYGESPQIDDTYELDNIESIVKIVREFFNFSFPQIATLEQYVWKSYYSNDINGFICLMFSEKDINNNLTILKDKLKSVSNYNTNQLLTMWAKTMHFYSKKTGSISNEMNNLISIILIKKISKPVDLLTLILTNIKALHVRCVEAVLVELINELLSTFPDRLPPITVDSNNINTVSDIKNTLINTITPKGINEMLQNILIRYLNNEYKKQSPSFTFSITYDSNYCIAQNKEPRLEIIKHNLTVPIQQYIAEHNPLLLYNLFDDMFFNWFRFLKLSPNN